MKTQTKPTCHKQLLFTASALVILLTASSVTVAQSHKFKVGDRVECDSTQMGSFDKGTVVPFDKFDLDKSGRWYRVKLDKDTIPNSTVECMANRMRLLAKVDEESEDNIDEGAKKEKKPDTGDPTSNKNKTIKYKPGDRVECDKAQIGVWEKGTVVHFLPSDTNKEKYYRVKLDGYKLYAEGHQCMVNFVRPIKEASLKGAGKYKVGDSVEAKNWGGSWLPAKIIAVEGAFYKVRFESRDSRHDETIDEDRIRPFGTAEQEAENQNKQNETRNLTPKMAGAFPSLPGTAWKIDFGKGLTGTVFLFCKSGRWEIVPARAGSIGAVGKSYSVSGSTLTTVNRDDGMVQRYRMTWKGGVLELFDGKVTLGLHYNGETQCK